MNKFFFLNGDRLQMLESPNTVLNAYSRVPLKIYTVRVAEVEPQMAWSFKQTLLYRESHKQ